MFQRDVECQLTTVADSDEVYSSQSQGSADPFHLVHRTVLRVVFGPLRSIGLPAAEIVVHDDTIAELDEVCQGEENVMGAKGAAGQGEHGPYVWCAERAVVDVVPHDPDEPAGRFHYHLAPSPPGRESTLAPYSLSSRRTVDETRRLARFQSGRFWYRDLNLFIAFSREIRGSVLATCKLESLDECQSMELAPDCPSIPDFARFESPRTKRVITHTDPERD